jgi:uncharacterized protein DUF6714
VSEPEAAVKASIHEAFASTPRPLDGDLVPTDPGEDSECDEIAANFQGKTWREVSTETIQRHTDSLPLLTPSAFRYFLPAYMLASLGPASAGFHPVDVMNFVLFGLVPPESNEDPKYFMARARQFNLEERQAIASYLKLVAERQKAEWGGNVPKPKSDEFARAIHFWQSSGDR